MTTEILQTETFRAWESNLRDRRVRTIIAARINRLAAGLVGDALVLLLCGGDKSSQARDIETAKQLAKNWRKP